MEQRVERLERLYEELERRQDGTTATVSALVTSLDNLTKALREHIAAVTPIVDSYRGIMSAKSIVLGLASILTALGVIGYALMHLWDRP